MSISEGLKKISDIFLSQSLLDHLRLSSLQAKSLLGIWNKVASHFLSHVQLKGSQFQLLGINASMKYFLYLSDPIRSSLPKFISKSIDVLVVKSAEKINLACPAQGFPLPSFR